MTKQEPTVPEILKGMLEAFHGKDQKRYGELWMLLEKLHKEAASRIRARNHWKIPHP